MNLEGGKRDAGFHPRWSTALCCLAAVGTNTQSQGCPSAASATATGRTRGSPIMETSTLLPCYIQFLSNLFSPNVTNCSSRFTGYFPKPGDTMPDLVLLEDCRKHRETASSQAFSWVLLLSKGQGTTEPREGLQNHPKAGMGGKCPSDPHLQPGDPRSPARRSHLQISRVLLTSWAYTDCSFLSQQEANSLLSKHSAGPAHQTLRRAQGNYSIKQYADVVEEMKESFKRGRWQTGRGNIGVQLLSYSCD